MATEKSLSRIFDHLQKDADRIDREMTSKDKFSSSNGVGHHVGQLENNAERFSVSVDVKGYEPEEVTVEIVGRELRVQGKRTEKSETGKGPRVASSFLHKYILPDDVDLEKLRSSLSAEGRLSVAAPKQKSPPKARPIPIEKAKK